MGNFKQHVTCSTVTGIALGGIGYHLGFSMPTSLLSAGLCGMAGMLPDIDSDSSRSFQECIYFAAGLCAVLLVDRLRPFGLDRDIIILCGAIAFMFVRFAIGGMIKKMTAHRGMFHSIPAAILTGEIVFFLTTGTVEDRVFKAFAISAGYFSHLILDEICSIDSTGKTLRLKKSFGTALKFYDAKRMPIVLALYTVVVFLGMAAMKNPELIGPDDETRTLQAGSSNPLSDLFDVFARLEREAVSKWGERSLAGQETFHPESSGLQPLSQASPQTIANRNEGGLAIPDSSAEGTVNRLYVETANSVSAPAPTTPVPVASGNGRYSEHRIFSRLRSSDSESGIRIPTENTSPSNPGPMAMNASPSASTQNVPIVPENPQSTGIVSPTTPYRLSGSDFGPRTSRQYTPPSPTRAPAPLIFP